MAEPSERFGQCVPADATRSERVECASALLALAGPAYLLAALHDAGLHLVTDADKRVLDAMGDIPEESLHWCEAISNGMDIAISAELARRGEKT